MHSKLKTSERLAEWMRIKSGEAKIVVGARTACFCPSFRYRCNYKFDERALKSNFTNLTITLKFETVDVAFRRAKYHNATLVLGSATQDSFL